MSLFLMVLGCQPLRHVHAETGSADRTVKRKEELPGAASAQAVFHPGNAPEAFMGGLPIKALLPCNHTTLADMSLAFASFILLPVFIRKSGNVPKPAAPA